ncbi:MAG: efflux RND transporter periplasmic adaptor subunit [Verrucomicrobiales bacterium]
MKRFGLILQIVVGLGCFFGTGVALKADANRGIPKVVQSKDDPNIGIKYKKNQGLFVTDISARLIGLRMADVEEKALPKRIEFTAQVYDTSPVGKALATGWVPTSQAEALPAGTELVVGEGTRGVITSVSLLSAAVNQQAEALLDVDDPEDRLAVGQFVEVSASLPSAGDAVVVPKSAVLKTSEGTFAYADNAGWKVRTSIKTGAQNDGYVEVIEGLLAGDSVVTNPVMTLWMTELQLTKSGKA